MLSHSPHRRRFDCLGRLAFQRRRNEPPHTAQPRQPPEHRAEVRDVQGMIATPMIGIIAGGPMRDRERLSDTVGEVGEVYVAQALSGG